MLSNKGLLITANYLEMLIMEDKLKGLQKLFIKQFTEDIRITREIVSNDGIAKNTYELRVIDKMNKIYQKNKLDIEYLCRLDNE